MSESIGATSVLRVKLHSGGWIEVRLDSNGGPLSKEDRTLFMKLLDQFCEYAALTDVHHPTPKERGE